MPVIENPERIRVETFPGAHVLDPFEITREKRDGEHRCVVILNQAITMSRALFDSIWRNADLRICADGGADRLMSFGPEYMPDYIVGDLDSLTEDTRKTYVGKGTKVKQQASQYHSDLDKAVVLCDLHFSQGGVDLDSVNEDDGLFGLDETLRCKRRSVSVLLVGAVGGRFDQTVHSINRLYYYSSMKPNLDIKLWNAEHDELIMLLKKGHNFILTPQEEPRKSYNLGMLPLGEPVTLTTHGLKWDVTNWASSMYGSVSSSNRTVGEPGVSILTDNDLVINLGLDI